MITPFDMENIYWSRIRMTSIYEVKAMLMKLKSPKAIEYWSEVLVYLNVKKSGRRSLS